MTGFVSSVLEPGPVKDGPDATSYSMDSMRALGKSDALHLRQYAEAVVVPAFDTHRIQSILWLSDAAGLETTTGPDTSVLSVDKNTSEHGKGWVLSTSTYVTMATIATAPLVLYMMYRRARRALHHWRLRRASDAKQEPEPSLADVEWLTGQAKMAADEDGPDEPDGPDGPESAHKDVLEKGQDEAVATLDGTQNDARQNFFVRPASFLLSQLAALPLPFEVSLVTKTSNALWRTSEVLNYALQKSANCIIDALAPFVFGSLLLLTTITGILLYGVGNVGITKIAQSGIFGLNEDAIDTLLEMIHMQWRLMRQLKWSWWVSVAGRYESRCQHGFQHKQQDEDGRLEHEPEHVHDHHICIDPTCPFRHLIHHSSASRPGVTPETGDQKTGPKGSQTKQMEANVEANVEAEAKTGGHHKSSRGHTHHHHHYHHVGSVELDLPKEHIKLETRRDLLRWLILGKDGNGSHYRDRHHRHKFGNSTPTNAKEDEQTSKDANTDQEPTKSAARSKI